MFCFLYPTSNDLTREKIKRRYWQWYLPKEILPIGNISLLVQMTILFDTVIRQNIYCHKINLSPGIPSKSMSVSADIGPMIYLWYTCIYLMNHQEDSDFHGCTISCKKRLCNFGKVWIYSINHIIEYVWYNKLSFSFFHFSQQNTKKNKHRTALLNIRAILKTSQ